MNELLTVAEVAHILRVDENTVRRWIKQGSLECAVLPSTRQNSSTYQTYRVKRSTLDRVLASTTVSR